LLTTGRLQISGGDLAHLSVRHAGRLNPGRNGLYCNAYARLALKRAKADGLRILDRREGE
jgi:hypothetical protein